jgi:hypothetical protein
VDGERQGEGGGTGDVDGEGDSAAKGGDDALDLAELEELPAEVSCFCIFSYHSSLLLIN